MERAADPNDRAARPFPADEGIYRSLVERANDAIVILQDHKIVFVNPQSQKIIGRTPEEVIGTEFMGYLAPEVRDQVVQRYRDRMEGKDVSPIYESLLVNKDGTKVPIEINAGIVSFNGKHADLVIIRDLTERRKAESALRAEHEKLLSLFDGISEPVYVVDPHTHEVLYANRVLTEQFGNVVGKRCHEAFQGLSDPCPFCTNDKIFGEYLGRSYVWEFQNRLNKRWYRCIDKAIPWPGGKMVRYEMAIDITESKVAEAALRESEERLNALFQASIDGIGVDREGRFAYVNTAFARLHGYDSPAELMGRSVQDTVAPEDRERLAEYSRMRRAGEEAPQRYEFKALRKDGTTFDAEISVSSYSMQGEQFIVGFVHDVTERKRREEDEMQRRVLEAKLELKSIVSEIASAFMETAEPKVRKRFATTISEKLDAVLFDRYFEKMASKNVRDAASAYLSVITDLGGGAELECPNDDLCVIKVNRCLWGEEAIWNIALCILCRGLVGRFAYHTSPEIMVRLEKTMADAGGNCVILVGKERAMKEWRGQHIPQRKKRGLLR
ncbi:MAG: PAS domain S-box protein [Candidatus Thermoplasmatota archaeon]